MFHNCLSEQVPVFAEFVFVLLSSVSLLFYYSPVADDKKIMQFGLLGAYSYFFGKQWLVYVCTYLCSPMHIPVKSRERKIKTLNNESQIIGV